MISRKKLSRPAKACLPKKKNNRLADCLKKDPNHTGLSKILSRGVDSSAFLWLEKIIRLQVLVETPSHASIP